jgi:ABC-2 type transport system ATP-binding protein
MIDVEGVSKSYGLVQALREVTFHVDAGEVIGLLGPNGAGKTTMIKILTGYLQADEGQVVVDGLDVLDHPLQVQRRIGYLPENAPLYPEMTVQSYLHMIAELRQVPEQERGALLADAVRAVGLQEQLVRPIGQLSKGYRQRVGLAQAILHRPKLLILDEPTVGLDPTQIVQVRKLIQRMSAESTVLLSTHILSEVEAACDRVIILLNGEIRADTRLSEIAATTDIVLVLGAETPDVYTDLSTLAGVRGVEVKRVDEGREYRISTDQRDLGPKVYEMARDKGWALRELRRDVPTLEMVFNQLTTAQGEDTDWITEEAAA